MRQQILYETKGGGTRDSREPGGIFGPEPCPQALSDAEEQLKMEGSGVAMVDAVLSRSGDSSSRTERGRGKEGGGLHATGTIALLFSIYIYKNYLYKNYRDPWL